MGTHLRVLRESCPVNTNMIRLRGFFEFLHSSALDERSLSIGRINASNAEDTLVQCTRKYENHPNQVMWVFIGKLSLSTTQVKIDGSKRAPYFDGPVTGPEPVVTGPLPAHYKPATGPF